MFPIVLAFPVFLASEKRGKSEKKKVFDENGPTCFSIIANTYYAHAYICNVNARTYVAHTNLLCDCCCTVAVGIRATHNAHTHTHHNINRTDTDIT